MTRVELWSQSAAQIAGMSSLEYRIEDSSKQLSVSFELPESHYNFTMTIRQTGERSAFYGASGFIPKASVIEVIEIDYFKDALFEFLRRVDTPLRTLVWTCMTVSSLLATVSNPWYGSLLLRTVATSSVLSHLNGPLLETSDLFFSIIGNVSLPVPVDRYLQTSPEESRCLPPENFRKFKARYASCSIVDLYGKSLVLFCCFALVSLWLTFKSSKSKPAVAPVDRPSDEASSEKKKLANPPSKISFLAEFYGVRFLIVVFSALSPLLLHLALLNLSQTSLTLHVGIGSLVSVCVVAVEVAIEYFYVLFIFRLNDIIHMRRLKRGEGPKTGPARTGQGAASPGKNHPEDGSAADGQNLEPTLLEEFGIRVLPPVKITNKEMKSVQAPVLEQFSAELNLFPKQKPRQPSVEQEQYEEMPHSQFLPLNRLKFDRSLRYSVMQVFIFNYKMEFQQEGSFLFYLPAVELFLNFVSQCVLVALSGRGVMQVYVVALSECVLLLLTVCQKPCEKLVDRLSLYFWRCLLALAFLLKLQNFWSVGEGTRQGLLDKSLLVCGVSMLAFSLGFSAYHAILGTRILFNLNKIVEEASVVQKVKKKPNTQTHASQNAKLAEIEQEEDESEDLDLDAMLAKESLTLLDRIKIKLKFGLAELPQPQGPTAALDHKAGSGLQSLQLDGAGTSQKQQDVPFKKHIVTSAFARNIERIRRNMQLITPFDPKLLSKPPVQTSPIPLDHSNALKNTEGNLREAITDERAADSKQPVHGDQSSRLESPQTQSETRKTIQHPTQTKKKPHCEPQHSATPS